jgi:hypothetical protein
MTLTEAALSAPARDSQNAVLPARPHPSKAARWSGRALSGVAVLFLAVDAVGKVLAFAPYQAGTVELGYPASAVVPIGIVELVCLAVYLVPRTALLGAVLWTGYLGGAIATHVRVESPLFSHILFPVYIAVFLWLGLWLRDRRLRALLPLSGPNS